MTKFFFLGAFLLRKNRAFRSNPFFPRGEKTDFRFNRLRGGLRLAILFPLIPLLAPALGALPDLYWEEPAFVSPGAGTFPVSAFNGNIAALAWQEPGPEAGSISISLAVKVRGGDWVIRPAAGGPYPYSGTEPAILSIAVDKRDRILIAAARSSTETEILISSDRGASFRPCRLESHSESSVAPRIFVRSDGGYLLFITRGAGQSLTIFYARSEDGLSWTPFEPFIANERLTLNFLPSHAALGSLDYVIFQSFVGDADTVPSFQLFLKTSADGGKTWTPARLFTSFQDPRMNTTSPPSHFDNQRPQLSALNGQLFLVWERRFGSASPQVYAARIGADGAIRGAAERVNSVEAYCNNPLAFSYRGEPGVIWFDNRRGTNRVYMALHSGLDWQNYDLSGSAGEASFARAAVDPGGLFVFWQGRSRGDNRICLLAPDNSVTPPRLRADNFSPGGRGRGDRVRVSWETPQDPSGIQGFSWYWGQDENARPPHQIMGYANARPGVEMAALEDGPWFFALIAQDYAGNWSEPSRVEYIRDTTPPPAAAIIPPALDEEGFLLSNTFELHWEPSPASDLAGYTWKLEYLGSSSPFAGMDEETFLAAVEETYPGSPVPAPQVMGTGDFAAWDNQDNGVWRFSVFAVDEVGNIGPPSKLFFRTSKYIPHTYISYVDLRQDDQGVVSLRIIGRGFTEGGNLSRVFLEREGGEPYRLDFLDNFSVLSDREIGDIRIDEMEEGSYRIGVEHPLRGLALYPQAMWVNETGTVKFGDYSQGWESSWTLRPGKKYPLDPAWPLLAAILIFCSLGLFVSARGIGAVIAEGALIEQEAAALITGDFMPSEKKQRLKKIRRRGLGLRFKLAAFTIALVLLVVSGVSTPLYLMMTGNQRETLLRGLWDRSSVLLEGLASGARVYLPSQNTLEMGFLLAQTEAIPEARYATITGFGGGTTVFSDHIWASNDPEILTKIDTAEFTPGVSRLQDGLSPRLEALAAELNGRAQAEVGDISRSITGLTREGLALAAATDLESRQRLQDIQVSIRSLEIRLNEGLAEIGQGIGSEPAFSFDDRSPAGGRSYIFFKPVLFRQGAEETFFRGLIRLEVSTGSILQAMAAGQLNILRVILIVALAAIALGTAGALFLAAYIIRPISRLAAHVERIRDTEDKAELEGVDIDIRSKDEIALLGSTINDMTHSLVKAAQAAEDLSIGKEIQKKFIPLELDRDGNKLSVGFKDTKNARFFGYYEGAKGVSGDYFDYQDLDGRYYAVIKCDVAGKGIPAALIMIQVATMFLNHFKAWKPTEKGMHIEEVVYQINDFIETLGFKGRFAAFTLCLFDSQTGLLRFCNAGDNLVHLYDASERRFKTLTLAETPATGVLPNILVEAKGGYRVQTLTLDPGDILLLYTDGIEEAKRKFRDSAFKEILCAEGPRDTPHGGHSSGQGDEEMGAERVAAIINAVQNREVYSLHKYHNPEGEMELTFDFSSCEGTVEETIMAMVSVEKIFRCYRNPRAGDDSRVLVDKKVDAFLQKHFLQYRNYCSWPRPCPGSEAYMYYTRLEEDAQYDDLTILGIMRK